jgi:hypothetical protein
MPTFRSRFTYWIPAICVGILISTFSTRYFSSDQTGSGIIPFLHNLLPSVSERQLHLAHVLVRKLAHVTEFGIFSTAVFIGVRGPRLDGAGIGRSLLCWLPWAMRHWTNGISRLCAFAIRACATS